MISKRNPIAPSDLVFNIGLAYPQLFKSGLAGSCDASEVYH